MRPHAMNVMAPGDWVKIVGIAIAQRSTPVAIKGDALVIKAHEWSWLDELSRMRSQIVERVNKYRALNEQFKSVTILGPGSKVMHFGGTGGKSA